MTREERPIVFTITRDNGKIRCYTKDGRVEENNREIEFNNDTLFLMMQFITGTFNNQGYAVLFEAD